MLSNFNEQEEFDSSSDESSSEYSSEEEIET